MFLCLAYCYQTCTSDVNKPGSLVEHHKSSNRNLWTTETNSAAGKCYQQLVNLSGLASRFTLRDKNCSHSKQEGWNRNESLQLHCNSQAEPQETIKMHTYDVFCWFSDLLIMLNKYQYHAQSTPLSKIFQGEGHFTFFFSYMFL